MNNSTTLHMAAEGGHSDIVQMLLDAGALATEETEVSIYKIMFQVLAI